MAGRYVYRARESASKGTRVAPSRVAGLRVIQSSSVAVNLAVIGAGT